MKLSLLPALTISTLLSTTALAADLPSPPAGSASSSKPPEVVLTIQKGQISPKEIPVPANTRVKLVIKNLGKRPVEFESAAIKHEKNIPAHGEGVMFIGPLSGGSFDFFDEVSRNPNLTAKIVVGGKGAGQPEAPKTPTKSTSKAPAQQQAAPSAPKPSGNSPITQQNRAQ